MSLLKCTIWISWLKNGLVSDHTECTYVKSTLVIYSIFAHSQATEDVQEGLTDDDYDMYYEIWQQFDPDGTQYLPYNQLSDFLDVLEPPLQIHKPNKYKIISMDIPICTGDQCFCVDVLDALTKDFFARKGNPVEETAELGEVTAHADRPGYDPISSTLWRQREDYCARLIQGAWRRRSTIPGEIFGSRLGSRSVLDAVAEEASEEEDEDDEETSGMACAGRIISFILCFKKMFSKSIMIFNHTFLIYHFGKQLQISVYL